jgi:hypothetical protein
MRKQREKARELQVGIYNGAKLVRIIQLLDPRAIYCREFNAYCGQGLSAYPISLATSTAKPKRLSE